MHPPARVVAASMDPLGPGLYAAEAAYVSPGLDDPGWLEWVIETCRRENARAVLSGVDPLLARLAAGADEIRRRGGAVCVVSPPPVLEVGDDKLRTCHWLRERGLPHPRFAAAGDGAAVAELIEACGYPLLAKPRRGHAAQGQVTVEGPAALDLIAGRQDLVLQEVLGDPAHEYTAGCVCDGEGRLRGTIVMRRELREGTTVRAEAGDFPAVRDVAEEVVEALAPVGPCNVQLREHDGRMVPFELNVRFSGTTPARTRFGFCEVEATLRHLVLGEPMPALPRVTEGVVVRYWNELYPAPAAAAALRDGGHLDAPEAQLEDWGR
jgi:carbamoyl-phosphate synthase large subunit